MSTFIHNIYNLIVRRYYTEYITTGTTMATFITFTAFNEFELAESNVAKAIYGN
jgi:hypothetical protein